MSTMYIVNENETDPTVGEIVSQDYRKAEVFRKYGINFCCGGKRTLSQACKTHNVDVVAIKKELAEMDYQPVIPSQNINVWSLDFLCDYVVNTHHQYVIKSMPLIFEYTQKVLRAHGDTQPEVVEIANTFIKIMDELNSHMLKEEKILFPYIKNLVEASENEVQIEVPHFGTVENPIHMMEEDHNYVGELMNQIKQLSNNYMPPAGACTTFRISYAKLQEFELDLHQHIHIENNILFPKAIALEKELA